MNKKMFAICCAAAMMLTVNMASFADAPQAEISNAPVVEENQVNPDDYLVFEGYAEDGSPIYSLDGISFEEYKSILESIPETYKVMHRHTYKHYRWINQDFVDCDTLVGYTDRVAVEERKCTHTDCDSIILGGTMRDHGNHQYLIPYAV